MGSILNHDRSLLTGEIQAAPLQTLKTVGPYLLSLVKWFPKHRLVDLGKLNSLGIIPLLMHPELSHGNKLPSFLADGLW